MRQKIKYLTIFMFLMFLSTTVAYAGLSTKLAITGEATFRPVTDIRVTNIELSGVTNGATLQYEAEYDVDKTKTGFILPNESSSITYKITVRNNGTIDQTIYEMITESTNNSNVTYEITGYNLKDPIAFNSSITFYITFKTTEGSSNVINYVIKYDFRKLYKIEYDANGGRNAPESQTKYENVDLTITNNIPTKTGYEFKGWTDSASSTTIKYSAGGTYTLDKDILLYAVWAKGAYTITYNLNGGVVDSSNPTSYTVDSNVITLNNPSKTGYTFSGWTEQITNLKWNKGFINLSTGLVEESSSYPNSHYSELIYLDAGKTYKLSGYGSYSSSSFRFRVYNLDGSYKENASNTSSYTPTSNCYIRILFYESSTEAQRTGTILTSGSKDKTEVIPKGSTGNKLFTANFTINKYTLTVKPNGGTWNGSTSNQTFEQDYKSTKEIAVPTTNAYYTISYDANGGSVASGNTLAYRSFSGWSLTGKGTITATTPLSTSKQTYTYDANNDTLTATYQTTANQITTKTATRSYTITYDLNGTGATSSKTTDTLSYTMNGWYTQASGGEKRAAGGGNYSPGLSEKLYAQWSAGTITLPTVTKTGYTCFWNTKSDNSGTNYESGKTGYTVSANTTLYAACTDTNKPTLSVTGNPTSWTANDVKLSVSASDSESGLKSVTVNNTAITVLPESTYTVSENGTYTFVATDNAGNTTTQSVVVSKIDKTTPTPPVLTGGSRTTTETSRTISVKTPGTTGSSGLKNYEVMTHNFLTNGAAPFHKVTKDLTISNRTYTTTGTDPYISYHDLGNVAIQSVIVQFSEATTHEMALTVFYMKEGEFAQGANSVVTTVPVGTTGFFTVDIPDGTYDALRFDLGNVSGVTYKISAIRYVNYTTRTAANDEYVISNRGVTSAYYRTVANNGKKSAYTVLSDDTVGYIDNSVAKVGNFRYSTLQKAITLAATNTATTVTLLKNVTESVQVSSAKSITINGQNYEVASGGNKPCITTNGTLTLNNLGLSTVNDSDHGASTLVVNGGSVTINISNNDLTIFSSGGHAIYMTGGTVTLNSGDVFANAANGIKAATLVTGGTLNINGGRISNPTGGNPVGMESSGVVSMKGGTLKSYEENSTCYAAVSIRSGSTGNFTMTGGTIDGCQGITYHDGAKGKITISGTSTLIQADHTGINIKSSTNNILTIGQSSSTDQVYPWIRSTDLGSYYAVALPSTSVQFKMYSGRLRSASIKSVYRGNNTASVSGKTFSNVTTSDGYFDAYWK